MRLKLPEKLRRLARNRRGVAAVEFAIIAPTLIVLFMGTLEMSFRFQASEEATRFVHQAADLVSREGEQTDDFLKEIYKASVHMMKPLGDTDNLDIDYASVGYDAESGTPYMRWRRVIGGAIPFDPEEAEGLGLQGETVIHVAVRYRYSSPVSSMFGGPTLAIVREAWARPRNQRVITINGKADHMNGAVVTLTAS